MWCAIRQELFRMLSKMPTQTSPNDEVLNPTERRRRVAVLLAQGVVRLRKKALLAQGQEFSQSAPACLENVSETRLSVSMGLTVAR
jgi:hypothetical protein